MRDESGTFEDEADLLWTAWRYSAGELAEPESAEFESELENDLAACEALAQAVRLEDDIHAAFAGKLLPAVITADREDKPAGDRASGSPVSHTMTSESPRAVSRLGRRVGLIATVAAVIAAAAFLFNSDRAGDSGVVEDGSHQAGNLVRIWADQDSDWQQEAGTDSEVDTIDDSEVDEGVPDWLLVAVQTERANREAGPVDDDEILEN